MEFNANELCSTLVNYIDNGMVTFKDAFVKNKISPTIAYWTTNYYDTSFKIFTDYRCVSVFDYSFNKVSSSIHYGERLMTSFDTIDDFSQFLKNQQEIVMHYIEHKRNMQFISEIKNI